MKNKSAKDHYKEGTDYQFETPELSLGPWTSYSLIHDPKHMSFVLARYKFCAKMLDGKADLLEVGCGDGFGMPIMAQNSRSVLGIDVDDRLINGNRSRLKHLRNVEFRNLDITKGVPERKFDAVYSIDVIEHLDEEVEKAFMENSVRAVKNDG